MGTSCAYGASPCVRLSHRSHLARRARLLLVFSLLLTATSLDAAAQTVRIGVFGLFKPRRLTLTTANSAVLVAHAGPKALVMDPTAHSSTLSISVAGSQVVVTSPEFTSQAPSLLVTGRGGTPADFILAVPGKLRRRFSGTLLIEADQDGLRAVVEMDLESAVASVVEAESLPGATMEARKAQAVVARSYFAAGTGGHQGFDFCDTTHCQFLRERPAPDTPSSLAARATRGLVLAYDGRPFPAMYSSRCGGRTRTLAELGMPVRSYPYYAVDCEYCRTHALEWSASVSAEDAARLSRRTETERLEVTRKLGWSGVPSNRYTVSLQPGYAVLSGMGIGHGLGLCQHGAAALAQAGASFSTILAHYYPNTSILAIDSRSLVRSH